jgi:hypothetical protein
MIEIGVALTWGIRILIIREKNAKDIPTDISGQTWAPRVLIFMQRMLFYNVFLCIHNLFHLQL